MFGFTQTSLPIQDDWTMAELSDCEFFGQPRFDDIEMPIDAMHTYPPQRRTENADDC
jgi:hypothetical protein